jgi:hypothetical protein
MGNSRPHGEAHNQQVLAKKSWFQMLVLSNLEQLLQVPVDKSIWAAEITNNVQRRNWEAKPEIVSLVDKLSR